MIEYYEDDTSQTLFAVRRDDRGEALFRLLGPDPRWQWLRPGSTEWDAAHQRIFRNHRVVRPDPAVLEGLPPVPEVPADEPPERWEDNFTAGMLPAARYPNVANWLVSADVPQTLQIVLHEDEYETMFGDGEFHYLHDVRPADATPAATDQPGQRYHQREACVRWDSGSARIELVKSRREMYDHYKDEDVMAMLEKFLAAERERGGG